MASPRAIAWVERLIWILVYAGLFCVVLGIAARPRDPVAGWVLIVAGGILTAVGAVLVWVRSRMRETP